ncbi:MAG: hypothetical protein RL228_869 [Actinomycetota bacterium]
MRKVVGLFILILILSGCAAIPTAGPIEIIENNVTQQDTNAVRVIAKPPTVRMNAVQIASGFVAANVSTFGDFEVARKYLTPSASNVWNPTSFEVLDSASIQYNDLGTGIVELSALQTGRLKKNHRFEIFSVAKPFLLQFQMENTKAGLRIQNEILSGILTSSDMVRGFSAFNVYFGNENFTRLVPEIVWLPKNEKSIGTKLVSALLLGSRENFKTAIPNGTALRFGSVAISNGVADINLNAAALNADNSQRKFMMAQFVWTLQSIPGVARVQISTNDRILSTQGKTYFNRRNFSKLDPDFAKWESGLFTLKNGNLSAENDGLLVDLGKLPKDIRFSISENQKRLAYTLNGELRTASVSKVKKYKSQFVDVQNSGYDNSGRVWFSNFRGNLFCLSTDGSIQKVLQLEGLRIQDLSVSPDGARVALIATTQSTSTLLVGSIVSENGILKVVGLHKVEQTLNEVSDVDWFNSTELAVIGQIGISESVVAQVSLTNGSLRNLNGPRKFNYISTSNKGALLAGSNSGSVWMFEDGQWIKFAKNVQAVYSK